MIDFEELKNALLKAAKEEELSEYEIYYKTESSISTETLKDEISNFSSGTSCGICFRCIVNGKTGYAATELLTIEQMYEIVRKAKNNALYIESDEKVKIFEGSEHYGQKTSDWKPLPDVKTLKNGAIEIQKNNYANGEYVTEGTQSYTMAYESTTRIINSKGLDLCNKSSVAGAFTDVVIKKDDEPSSGSESYIGDDFTNIKSISEKAYENALEKLGAGSVESGKYNIVISGKQMRNILSAYFSIFSGFSARIGTTMLKGREGEQVANKAITIIDDPFDVNCPVQTNFDAEGVASYKKNVVEDGIFKTFLYNIGEAELAGKQTTGNAGKAGYAGAIGIAPYCFSIKSGNKSLDDLMKIVGNGVYVTYMKGLHAGVNANTGDFSIECEGFMIENGKKGKPVKSFTIAGNFYQTLMNITHVGDKTDYGFPGSATVFASPDVLIENVDVAGK